MFTKVVLESSFHSKEWLKGQRVFEQNSVLNGVVDGSVLRGSVKSESHKSEIYLTRIEYDKVSKQAKSYCNCYVGRGCKHAAALAHYYLKKIHATTASNFTIDKWLNTFSSEPAIDSVNVKSLLYFLQTNPFSPQDYLQLSVKTAGQKLSGGWSKTLGTEHLSSQLIDKSFVLEEDVRIISSITSNRDYRDSVTTHALLEQLVNTGRCYWSENAHLDRPIGTGETVQATWQWHKLMNNAQKLVLQLDEPSQDIIIVKSQPLSYYHKEFNVIGMVQTNTASEYEARLLNSPVIDEEKLPWVLNKLEVSLGDTIEKLPKPKLNKQLSVSKPNVHLHLSTPFENQPTSTNVSVNFEYEGIFVNPNNREAMIKNPHNDVTIYRNLLLEERVIELLKSHGCKALLNRQYYEYEEHAPVFTMSLQGRQVCLAFIHNELPKMRKNSWQIEFDKNFYYKELSTDNVFDAEIIEQDSGDFFSIGLNLEINGKKIPAFPILQSALEQLPKTVLTNSAFMNKMEGFDPAEPLFVELDDGEFIALSYKSIQPLLQQFIELFMPGALQHDGSMKLSKFQGHQTLSLLDDQGIITTGENKLRELSAKLQNFEEIQAVELPSNLHAELREYQHQGVNWLQFLREYELAGILADDMGLGKTIQALAHLLIEKEQGRLTRPCLIVAPTSVLYNWANEVKKFTPDLSYIVLHGSKRQQDFEDLQQYDLVITSYALILKDIELHQNTDYYYLILDEAHYIKNPRTSVYQAVLTIQAQHKLCLTGTPMENHLGEFWAQFNFLLPGFLSGHKQFTKLFRTPIEKHQDIDRKVMLNQRIKPFLLRRTKEKIAKELPGKTTIVQMLRIEGKQAELYETVRLAMDTRLKEIIATKGLQRSQIEILDALLKLRQVCNHPQLLPMQSAKAIKQSAKLEFLMETLPEMIEEGRRVLVFSQFTSMLSLIEAELIKERISFVKLTGETRNRQELVDKFQRGDTPVFLISLRAGGVGLNLTAADTVIHFDPWWNPAVENQATDRAYRIGQDKPVFVYKLIIENSIEERIQQIQINKAELANALLSEEVNQGKLSLTDDILKTLLAPLV
ncbi:Snf2 family protein [Glaciecola punicea ACAM 611]|jgi:SNF2 family DNA or RNA helicase|uniref:Snf2 family protein n=1 Tax=Glaciecola punicea ACAM 611 TaxID=1121923 RepID=H5TBQ1_9ALTE|nr:DEAD/DEAH box helicase [Glaciecola punicea]GAB55728.1 Snf2 family protein [Glaciecola punicea ACAM 611]